MEEIVEIDSLLSADELEVRNTVRRFVDDEVIPLMADAYENASFPEKLIPRLAKLGLLGITLPEEYGCANASSVVYGLVCQELERGDSGLRSFVSVQNSLCMFPIFTYGSDEQKKKFLPKMAAGEMIGCFGLTEPDHGSDPSSMSTTAKKVKDGWVLNGAKTWITNATIADLAIVWAQTEDGIRGFIVEKDFNGFSTRLIKQKLSLRASVTGELIFEDCFVPDSNYLPGSDKGIAAPLSCLNQARYGIAWGTIGAARVCYDYALTYAKERIQFGKPIASFQLIQKDLVDMYAEIIKSQHLNLHIGRMKDQGKNHFAAISLIKMNGCHTALDIARKARNIMGANGISLEYHVIRHMTNLESVITYEGTDNIHHLIIGKYITGEDAFF